MFDYVFIYLFIYLFRLFIGVPLSAMHFARPLRTRSTLLRPPVGGPTKPPLCGALLGPPARCLALVRPVPALTCGRGAPTGPHAGWQGAGCFSCHPRLGWLRAAPEREVAPAGNDSGLENILRESSQCIAHKKGVINPASRVCELLVHIQSRRSFFSPPLRDSALTGLENTKQALHF